MSEYQFYEFQTIDKALTDEEQAAIRQISSRVQPTRTRAIFVYNYSDFPRDPQQVLLQYFDAMLYLANWGSKRLMFRFPKHLIDLEQVQPYCVEELISFTTVGEYVVMDIHFWEEGGGYWIEGEGWLSSLVRLREDILQQDYRALYLAWLKAVPYEGFADYVYEPPVPPGLGQLSPSLRDFVELFEVDEHLVQVAAKASSNQQTVSSERLQQAIPKLSREECNDFLARLVEGEANLYIKLNRRLRELAGTPQPVGEPQRTVGQLFVAAEEERERGERRKAEEARAERTKELEALAQREARAWQEVEALIQKSQPRGYDQAVQLLVKLQELAVYQGRVAAFQARLNQIYQQYSRRSSLIARLSKADLRQR